MYASDVIRRNRNATVAFNLQQQQAAFDAGLTNHIIRQGGGTDYQFVNDINQAEAETPELLVSTVVPVKIVSGNKAVTLNLRQFTRINFTGIYDSRPTLFTDGSGNYILDSSGNPTKDSSGNPILTPTGNPVLDDSAITIPMGGMDFYFFGTNYGANNTIYWYTNNAIVFGNNFSLNTVNLTRNTIPAILLGNFDRLCSELYYSNSKIYNSGTLQYNITTIIIEFSEYYTDTVNFQAGVYQVRFIRELSGFQNQWVEVSIISSPTYPGYSNNTSVIYPSGYILDASGNRIPIDSNGNRVDVTKNSPYDITDGITFQNVAGTAYSTASPPAGTSFLYRSDPKGYSWVFINNAYLNI